MKSQEWPLTWPRLQQRGAGVGLSRRHLSPHPPAGRAPLSQFLIHVFYFWQNE